MEPHTPFSVEAVSLAAVDFRLLLRIPASGLDNVHLEATQSDPETATRTEGKSLF